MNRNSVAASAWRQLAVMRLFIALSMISLKTTRKGNLSSSSLP